MTANNQPKIGAILLAAGGSTRLGQPKQLVQYNGETLIRRAAKALIEARCSPVVVVLGGEIDGSRSELTDLAVDIVINDEWRSGMSSSIRQGLDHLTEIEHDSNAVLITLCDQPQIDSDFLARFVERYKKDKPEIIATDHDGVKGVPAIFSSNMFDQLLSLAGDKGARDMIRRSDKVATIRADTVFSDIDTPEDLQKLETGQTL